MNDSIACMKKRGKYYSLATFLDNGYIQTTWLLMFGDISSDKTMTGCTGNSFQFVASIESDELHTYFPVTNSQASSIEIGSYVSVGHEYMSGSSHSNDRYDKRIHEIAFDVKVLKIETLDDNNKAVYLDCDAFSTVHQESGDTQLRCIMSSMHWRTGFNKDVKGRTGSPCPTVAGLTNRRYPIVFQGIEMQLGIYEIMSGFSIITGDNTCEIYGLADATKAVTTPKQNQAGYIKLSEISITSKNAWNYITHLNFKNGYLCAASCGESGSGSSKGCGDAIYLSGGVGETRELLSFGVLGNWDACGLFCLLLAWVLRVAYRRSPFCQRGFTRGVNSARKRGFLPSLTRVCVSAPLQSFGNLRNRDTCGLFYLNLNNRLGNCRWNIGGRNSKKLYI